jgi:MFS family permease
MSRDRLLTRPFVLVSLANFSNGMSFALFLHFSGYLADLGANDTQIGLIYGATAVASIAMRPLVGTAMDRYGRRPVIIFGNVLNVTFILLYLTVSVLGPWVYIVRIGHGVAEAMLFSSLFTYGTDVIPASRRTEGIAIFGVSGLLPIAVAGMVGDIVLALAGFRELFITAALFAALAFLFSLPLEERKPETTDANRPKGFWSIVRQRTLLPIWWMIGSFSFVLTGYFVFIRRYVDDTGLGSVGLFFAMYSGVAIAERVFLGWLPDRIGQKRVLFPALGALVAGFVVLAGATSWMGVAVAGALCGAGHGFAFPILTSMLVDRAPEGDRGSAMSIFTSLFDVGTLIGGPILGALIDGPGWRAMYLFSAVFLAIAIAIYAWWDARVMQPRPDVTYSVKGT